MRSAVVRELPSSSASSPLDEVAAATDPPPSVPQSEIRNPNSPPPPPRLLDSVRKHLRVRHYSIRTEQAYLDWIKRFILFHGKRHPTDMAEPEIASFLTHLAVDRHVAASTQNQALSALLFLYHEVLERKLLFMGDIERVKRPPKVPVVLTPREVQSVLAQMEGDYRLMADLLYGSGLRLMDA